jgi:hypothetical protein
MSVSRMFSRPFLNSIEIYTTTGFSREYWVGTMNLVGIQVASVGGLVTDWGVALEGTINGSDWKQLMLRHRPGGGEGEMVWATVPRTAMKVRINVDLLVLGPASGLKVSWMASRG